MTFPKSWFPMPSALAIPAVSFHVLRDPCRLLPSINRVYLFHPAKAIIPIIRGSGSANLHRTFHRTSDNSYYMPRFEYFRISWRYAFYSLIKIFISFSIPFSNEASCKGRYILFNNGSITIFALSISPADRLLQLPDRTAAHPPIEAKITVNIFKIEFDLFISVFPEKL